MFVIATYSRCEQKMIIQEDRQACVIFDIDGTILDSSHRDPFSATDDEILNDREDEGLCEMIRSMYFKLPFVVITARDKKYFDVTMTWLRKHIGEPTGGIYMRERGDIRPDFIVKEELLEKVCEKYRPIVAFEDTITCAQMYEKNGIRTWIPYSTVRR